jgi:cyanophycin synthetase
MQIRRVHALLGPNVWSELPVLEALVDLGELRGTTATNRPGFVERFVAWSSAVGEIADADAWHSFVARLRGGIDLNEAVVRVAVELQTLACRCASAIQVARPVAEAGLVQIAFEMEEELVARACLEEACGLVAAAVHGRPYDPASAIVRLRDVANRICIGPSTGTIVDAARRRGIPFRRLDDNSLILLGHGCRQRRIRMAVTSDTRAIAQDIAQDKEVTKSLLRTVGLPVPMGRVVENADDAWQAATEIGLPVVVKPRNANHGRGVTINITTAEKVREAYSVAVPEGDGVIVETFARGSEHRLLIVDGRLVAASRGEPEEVVGDGRSTVRELVEEVNRDPRRGDDWAAPLCKIELDPVAEITLSQQGLTVDAVPPAGMTVLIHQNGEFLTDVTDIVHPETAAVAELAARVVGLNVAGIDIIARDISQPPWPQGARIIEVNAGPGLRMHFQPQHGTPRPVGDLIVSTMFAPDDTGRVPIVAVCGDGATTVSRLLRQLLITTWPHVGTADAQGLVVGGHVLGGRPATRAGHAHGVLLHPDTQAAIFEIAPASVLSEGLGFDHCDVVIFLRDDARGKNGPAKRVVARSLQPAGGFVVVEAGDTESAAAIEPSVARILFAERADDPALAAHQRSGGRVVFVDGSTIALADGMNTTRHPLPAAWSSAAKPPLLAAVAAAWALGRVPADLQGESSGLA